VAGNGFDLRVIARRYADLYRSLTVGSANGASARDRHFSIVQLPSPPRKNVFREWSGGMGNGRWTRRARAGGMTPGYYDIPYSAYLYIAPPALEGVMARRFAISIWQAQPQYRAVRVRTRSSAMTNRKC